MKLIFRAMGRYKDAVFLAIFIKLLGTLSELAIPYILEYIIDKVVPLGVMRQVVLWGTLMFAAAIVTRWLNVFANRLAIDNAHKVSYDVRQELFRKTANLSGNQFDAFGLPSLISRMTSDSYNVQSTVQRFQTLCVRAPMLLLGGVTVTLMMDPSLAMILVIMLPVLILVVLAASERVFKLLDEPEEVKDIYGAKDLENCKGHVKAENVSFGYMPGKTVLHDLNLEAKPGQTVAIVGPTGAGKTTIINLLMRFYDPDEGFI